MRSTRDRSVSSSPARYTLRNEVRAEVVMRGDGRVLRLPPLGHREITDDQLIAFDRQKLEDADKVHVEVIVDPIDGRARRLRGALAEATKSLREKAALLAVIIVGLGLPAVVLFFTTGLYEAMRRDLGSALDPELNAVVVLRTLQLLFLGVAITFPALLYFLFDRQRAETLRSRFVFNIFRLDERVRSRGDVEALYGRQMEEVFGCTQADWSSRHPRTRHRSPLVITTLVLAIGWIVALLNLDVATARSLDVDSDGTIAALFDPAGHVLVFGFLGAYFFSVSTVLRSYVLGDLQPKIYSQITGRILLVAVLTSVISLTEWGDNRAALAVAFFAGIVPDTVLLWLWEGVRKLRRTKEQRRDAIAEAQPLTELDGIDLYERARLSAEGVTNVEALAHGNLIDLLLHTRIPGGRLVDWVDQAILYLHTALRGDGSTSREIFDALRALGIRTATDFHRVTDTPEGMDWLVEASNGLFTIAQLQLLRLAIADDEWMRHLRSWRRQGRRSSVNVDLRPTAPAPVLTVVRETDLDAAGDDAAP
jgi:hypothetical protein